MDAVLIGYARVATDERDLTARQDAFAAVGVTAERIYVDQGPTAGDDVDPDQEHGEGYSTAARYVVTALVLLAALTIDALTRRKRVAR